MSAKSLMLRIFVLSGALFMACSSVNTLRSEPLIVDHTSVAQYAEIPQEWIDRVKQMWINVPGESHSYGYRLSCQLLQQLDSRFAVNVTESGTPEGPTTNYLRINRATWGDVRSSNKWVYGYGEEDCYTSSLAVERTKAHIAYCNTHSLPIAAFGFGWCWDMTWHNSPGGGIDPVYQVRWAGSSVGGPDGDLRWGLDAEDTALTTNSVCMDTYLQATQSYIDFCKTNGFGTRVCFTTGPADGSGESGYQRHLKNEHIRNYVRSTADGVLFDYADILCWSDSNQVKTITWRDYGGTLRTFSIIHSDNMLDMDGTYVEDGDHIGQRGALRLGKALWYMLARIAGWDPDGSLPVLTITAQSTNTIYGAPLPPLVALYSGFLNGDSPESLTALPVLTTTATVGSPAGTYPITVSGASSTNYSITYVDGTLTINKASTSGSLSSSQNPSRPNQPVSFNLLLSAVAPGAGIPTGAVQFKIDGTNTGSAVALSGGSANYSTSELTHGTHSIVTEYTGDGNFFGITNLLEPNQLINTPPVAGLDTIERTPTGSVKIAITALLSNDSDEDGDTVTFFGHDDSSEQGQPVSVISGWIYYTPTLGFTNTDSFTYSISDGWDLPVTGTVTVNIRVDNGSSLNLAILNLNGNGYEIRGDGIPGRAYRILYVEDIDSPTWQVLGTNVADDFGRFTYFDTNALPQRFYRSICP